MEERILFRSLTNYTKDVGSLNKHLVYIIFTIILLSCSHEKKNASGEVRTDVFQEKLSEFKQIFPILRKYKWEVHSGFESEDKTELLLDLDSKNGDTLIVAGLNKSVVTEYNDLRKCYTISRFVKSYSLNSLNYEIHTVGGKEVMFHFYYKSEIDEPEERVFITGKYRYLYELGVLDSLQVKYYLQHKDSLNQVKGDNLPELPR